MLRKDLRAFRFAGPGATPGPCGEGVCFGRRAMKPSMFEAFLREMEDDAVKAQDAGPSPHKTGSRPECAALKNASRQCPCESSGVLQCVRLRAENQFHHSQARLWFGSATPNDHALRILQMTALRPLRDQIVPGGPLEWDAAPFPRLAALMKSWKDHARVALACDPAVPTIGFAGNRAAATGKFPARAKPLSKPKVCLY